MSSSKLPGRLVPGWVFAVLLGLVGLTLLAPNPAAAASNCSLLTRDVRQFLHPKKNVSVLTFNPARFAGLKKAGYADKGVLFKAGSTNKRLTPVRVMYAKKTGDRVYTTKKSEIAALKKKGYRDNGTGFHAYTKAGSCLVGVYRFKKGSLHRYAVTSADQSALRSAGWTRESVAFYVAKPPARPQPTPKPSPRPAPEPSGAKFTIAVMSDTQRETLSAGDRRFANRTQWLADNAKALDLRFVTHTGDVVDWDTDDHLQYKRAAAALGVLKSAGIPYSLSPGNHDTAAVCPGGSACPGAKTWETLRVTTSYNTFLSGGVQALGGRFEPEKVDNTFSTFEAEGLRWLVLNLEMWPRVEVVRWAQQVVASHPNYNVIIATHSYLTSSGGISASAPYGSTTPQYLYENLVSRYANVRIVLSGHSGKTAHRVDQGRYKNRIDSFLMTLHDKSSNPVRLIEIDTAGSLRTWVYGPSTGTNYPSASVSATKLDWVE